MQRKDVQPTEHIPYIGTYLKLLPEDLELISGYKSDKKYIIDFFSSISEEKFGYRYQPEKWSIKEVLQHMIDNERIFTMRLFRISRKDTSPLPGYEQDDYVASSDADKKTKEALIQEFIMTRDFTINLLESLSDEQLKFIGTASNNPISARACAFLTLGHGLWHMNIIKERYL